METQEISLECYLHLQRALKASIPFRKEGSNVNEPRISCCTPGTWLGGNNWKSSDFYATLTSRIYTVLMIYTLSEENLFFKKKTTQKHNFYHRTIIETLANKWLRGNCLPSLSVLTGRKSETLAIEEISPCTYVHVGQINIPREIRLVIAVAPILH